jgi:hypothetical protein
MKNSLIERQIGILRTILGDVAERELNSDKDFILFVKEYFGFETDFGWNILMNAMYVFEDTELAKQDFEKFGIKGPCRHINTGENYLRLYGVLNAIYQQSLATINLMEIFKLTEKNILKNELKKTQCVELRNKIASHPSNYLSNTNEKSFDVYEISRHNLENGEISLLKNQDYFENYDLNKLIKDFNTKTQDILSLILSKFLKKKFQNQGKNYIEFQKLEKIRNGGLEFGGTIITFEK